MSLTSENDQFHLCHVFTVHVSHKCQRPISSLSGIYSACLSQVRTTKFIFFRYSQCMSLTSENDQFHLYQVFTVHVSHKCEQPISALSGIHCSCFSQMRTTNFIFAMYSQFMSVKNVNDQFHLCQLFTVHVSHK